MSAVEPFVEQWAARIRPHLAQAVEGIVAAGRELIAAKEALPHGQFGPLLASLDLSRQMANRFMRVASNPVLAKCSPVGGLPAAVSVLDTLTQLPDEELEAAIEAGEITPSTTRQQAVSLVKQRAHEAELAERDQDRLVDEEPQACLVLPQGDPCRCCDSTDPSEHASAVRFRSTCRRCGRDNASIHIGDVHLCTTCQTAILSEWGGDTVPAPPADWCCGWPVHPALADIPPMNPDERAGLWGSIQQHGLLNPVTTWRGYLLDGRERLMACEATGVEPRFREYEGDDPAAYVWSLNVCRQSFTPDQLAAIQIRAEELLAEVRS